MMIIILLIKPSEWRSNAGVRHVWHSLWQFLPTWSSCIWPGLVSNYISDHSHCFFHWNTYNWKLTSPTRWQYIVVSLWVAANKRWNCEHQTLTVCGRKAFHVGASCWAHESIWRYLRKQDDEQCFRFSVTDGVQTSISDRGWHQTVSSSTLRHQQHQQQHQNQHQHKNHQQHQRHKQQRPGINLWQRVAANWQEIQGWQRRLSADGRRQAPTILSTNSNTDMYKYRLKYIYKYRLKYRYKYILKYRYKYRYNADTNTVQTQIQNICRYKYRYSDRRRQALTILSLVIVSSLDSLWRALC